MLEKQFINFTTPDAIMQEGRMPLMPMTTGNGIEFYTADPMTDCDQNGVTISIVTPDCMQTYSTVTITNHTDNHIIIGAGTGTLFDDQTMLAAVGYGCPFRFKYQYRQVAVGQQPRIIAKVSQIIELRDNRDKKLAHIRYRCADTTGGIPYLPGQYVSAWMPICLDKPQFIQDSEIYTKLSGDTTVLFSAATKEYEAQSDYIPFDWHDKLLNALMSDEVYINGEKLQKSADYDIKWDSIETRHNRIKLAKAEWKMKACTLTRNTNI